jgi:hypothetical protein
MLNISIDLLLAFMFIIVVDGILQCTVRSLVSVSE